MTQVARNSSLDLQSGVERQLELSYQPVPPAGWTYLWQQTRTSLPLILGDALAVTLSTSVAYLLGGGLLGWSFAFTASFLSLATAFGLRLLGLYPAIGMHPAYEMKRMLTVIAVICSCLLFASLEREFVHHRSWWSVLTLWLTWSVLAPTMRSLCRSIFQRFDWWTQPVIFLGSAELFQKLGREFERNRSHGLRPIGFFQDTHQQWFGAATEQSGLLGDLHEASDYARRNQIYWAVVLDQEVDEAVDPEQAHYAGIPHRLFQRADNDAVPSIWDELFYLDRTSFIHQTDKLLLPHNLWIKRAMDLVATSLLVVLTAPLVLLIALTLKLSSRGPVFYRSARIGADGQRFAMTKFRTMRQDADAYLQRYLERHPERRAEWDKEQKLKNDPRVTWIGKFLRRTSLDELPQIYDVFMGKMSLVGPRPMLLDEPELYGPHFQSFCRMLPGMTGLWQVSGRNRISHDQRTVLVSYYVQNWSPWLDLYLLAKTFKVVITGDGAY